MSCTKFLCLNRLMILTSDAYSLIPCFEVFETIFTATYILTFFRKPLYTPPKPPSPSFSVSAKLAVARANWW
ncbi:hypothetical protein HanIR_Chr03g0115291 [Helianthus annuus]|nr:hypothetical protein HanIR_Chr03g0115291 [Helianthus annuus]